MKPWSDRIVISQHNKIYEKFQFFINFLCLISSFYYGSIAGIRYSEFDAKGPSNLIWMLSFEGIFFVHLITQFLLEYQVEGSN